MRIIITDEELDEYKSQFPTVSKAEIKRVVQRQVYNAAMAAIDDLKTIAEEKAGTIRKVSTPQRASA